MTLCLAAFTSTVPAALAEPDVAPKPPTNQSEEAKPVGPSIKKIGDNIYQLGDITINKKTREIEFPAIVNINQDTLIEYILVNPEGRSHESLFVTDIRPSHLNIAFKLLGYKQSKELLRKVNKDFQPLKDYETATPEQKKKSRFFFDVSWSEGGKKKSYRINQLIKNARTSQPLPAGAWVYHGSFFHQGKYIADLQHDHFALLTDRAALGNYAGPGREDDTLWLPQEKTMPEQGTKVTITITPQNLNKK